MNSYTKSLMNAIKEIHDFAETDEGKKWDKHWYEQIIALVEKIKIQNTDEQAERYLDMLLHGIVDSGPLGKGFAPSIDAAAGAMQIKRKKAFKEKRI